MRLLLAVGCDTYDHIGCLGGAELDAKKVFALLTSPEVAGFDSNKSILLLSPTSDELRQALKKVLIEPQLIEELTIYFAGHGCISASGFYMCTKDSRTDALPVTAMSLADILKVVAQAQAIQTNVIIDACESNGMVDDLGAILRTSILGKAGTPGITLLVSAASDEYAIETDEGGAATNVLVACIRGGTLIRDDVPTLDLVEIGRAVTSQMRGVGQTPVLWGLNLKYVSRFCANPHYTKADVDVRSILTSVKAGGADMEAAIADDYAAALWKFYYSLPGEWNRSKYVSLLQDGFNPAVRRGVHVGDLVYRLCSSMLERVSTSVDRLVPIEVIASTLCAVTKWLDCDDCRRVAGALAKDLIRASSEAVRSMRAQLTQDNRLMLRGSGGLADLFYLPLRVCETLGWMSLSTYEEDDLSINPKRAADFLTVARMILDACPGAFTAMAEEQAPFIVSTVVALNASGARDECEEMLGFLLGSSVDCGAMFCELGASGKEAFEYLHARAKGELDASNVVARPSELLTVILRLGQLFDLDEVFNAELWRFDREPCLAFFPESAKDFAAAKVSSGENRIWTVGRDVFTLADFGESWSFKGEFSDCSLERFCMNNSAMVFKDRVSWRMLDGFRADVREEVTGL